MDNEIVFVTHNTGKIKSAEIWDLQHSIMN